MGSDLYISIERQYPNGNWFALFDGPSKALDRGIVVDAFGDGPREEWDDREKDEREYVDPAKWREMAKHPECPWHLDEPYWVRCIEGAEFVAIVREKRWQKLQDGDFAYRECSPDLRAFAALVDALLQEVPVRVWAWHSQ